MTAIQKMRQMDETARKTNRFVLEGTWQDVNRLEDSARQIDGNLPVLARRLRDCAEDLRRAVLKAEHDVLTIVEESEKPLLMIQELKEILPVLMEKLEKFGNKDQADPTPTEAAG